MRIPPCAAAVLLLAAVVAAHNGETPAPPPSTGIPGGGTSSPRGRPGTGRMLQPSFTSAASVEHWWTQNRDWFLDVRGRRRAARAAARGEPTPTETPAQGLVPDPRGREKALAALRLAAGDDYVELAVHAVVALGKARDTAAFPLLVRIVDDPVADQTLRQAAVFALGLLCGSLPEAREHVRRLIADPSRREEERGLGTLGAALGPDVGLVPTLSGIARLRDSRRDVPGTALLSLGLCGDALVLPDLTGLLSGAPAEREPDWILRAVGAAAVGKVGSRDGIPALVRALSDDITGVRRQAALSLGALLTPADEAALQCVARFVRTERDPTTRSFAALSLAESGWPGAEAPLLDLYLGGDTLERSFSAVALGVLVRSTGDPALAARIRPLLRGALEAADNDEKKKSLTLAVGLAGDRTAGPLIRRLASEACDPPTMAAYAVSLGLVGDRDARPLLIDLLQQNCYQHLREDAARALGMLGDEDSIAVLVACLRGRNPDYYRGSAALALGYLLEPDESGPLSGVLGDAGEIPLVRAQCARALGRVLDPGAVPVPSRLTRHVDLFLPIDTLGIVFRLL